MHIQHSEEDGYGKFYVEENGQLLAELVYNLDVPGKMTIEHTQVSDQLAGKGAGKDLVRTAVDYARKSHFKIIPQCPFASKVIRQTKEFQDVLDR